MKPEILFAHGAGVGSQHPWMASWAERLGAIGRVSRFDYPYMAAGRRGPDRLPRLIEAHKQALAAATEGRTGPVVLAGKSMGSRVGCHVSLEVPVSALICFGYPLVGMGKTAALRDEVLIALDTPILFVQGTRDKLCPLELLDDVRRRMTAASELLVVEAGDHSLQVTRTRQKQEGRTQEDIDDEIAEAVSRFLGARS